MFPVSIRGVQHRLLASAATVATIPFAHAQTAPQELPPVVVRGEREPRPVRNRVATPAPVQSDSTSTAPTATPAPLGVKTADQARQEIQQTPGGVAVVAGDEYKNNSVANTIKDILGYVPGVFAQPKWGDDTRLSIRGSGLSRNFHLRGVQLYMDGIPINTSDGYGDFQEIDPTAYQAMSEVFKGANALTASARIRMGGAINFVTPTGRTTPPSPALQRIDRRLVRLSAASKAEHGWRRTVAWDGFLTASESEAPTASATIATATAFRGSGNIGYQDHARHRDSVLLQRQRRYGNASRALSPAPVRT